jgi:4-amino-4-deoxy-L-arabinose transferase-like glycosyltransferase
LLPLIVILNAIVILSATKDLLASDKKLIVILSKAKDLWPGRGQILRFAQDDRRFAEDDSRAEVHASHAKFEWPMLCGVYSRGIPRGYPASHAKFEWLMLCGLALVALIPRILLATQLDLVTDEIIYIMGGKAYFPLLLHMRFTSDAWAFNYEHPPVVKLLIGFSLSLNAHLGSWLSGLLAARVPSILCGTLLVVAIYWLGRAPFGRLIALLAALCLAVSPWLVYFSALAYLDMTMTALITIAYLVLWPAIRQPRLYLLSAVLVGLGVASKYTATLAIPGMILFTAYYFLAIRPRLTAEQRPAVPWLWWIAALVLMPVVFFVADPAIWRSPFNLLRQSVLYEWQHSINGHLTFIAGQYGGHVPHWAVLYILVAKLSIFVTAPAAFFLIFALIQLFRFHRHCQPERNDCHPERSEGSILSPKLEITEVASMAFLAIWLVSLVSMFSMLNIVVGTHYLLPLAPPLVLAGVFGLATLLRYRRGTLFMGAVMHQPNMIGSDGVRRGRFIAPTADLSASSWPHEFTNLHYRAPMVVLAVLLALCVGPHLLGLTTVYGAEGYTSELFNGENSALQVAYPAYREAGLWLVAHTHTTGRVGLVALPGTLNHGDDSISWYSYNHDITGRLTYSEIPPNSASFPYDYLVWPMHLVQRGYLLPGAWRSHIVHTIMGGNTIYCYILASNPLSS